MKLGSCAALMGALMAISSVDATTTGSEPPHPTARPDAAKNAPRPTATNRGSFYDYNAAKPVSEHLIGADVLARRDDGWRAAPNDARLGFFRGRRAGYAPMIYPYPPSGSYYSRPGVELDQQGFNGGVGGMEAGGGGYGGQAYLYSGQGGGSAAPSNGGGVNLPPGYGPTYRGVWQGPVNPTRGGLRGR